jgi:hypothetical protein
VDMYRHAGTCMHIRADARQIGLIAWDMQAECPDWAGL